jgi:hypothetical protein
VRAPWGYGASFDAAKLPAPFHAVAARLAACPDLGLGALRDVTVNARADGFFRLDPHLDPPSDGANVFILGLGSPTVLTLSPLGPVMRIAPPPHPPLLHLHHLFFFLFHRRGLTVQNKGEKRERKGRGSHGLFGERGSASRKVSS